MTSLSPMLPVAGQLVSLEARPVRSLAMFYDGTPAGAGQLCRWVAGLGRFSSGGEDGTVVVREFWTDDEVHVRPGQYLVFAQEGAGPRWAVHDPARIVTWFTPRVREMPIFRDGEVVP